LLLIASLLSFHVAAQVAATVEGVQTPAWVERDGKRTPLVPGMELKAGDQVITGAGSRIAIKLSEGSLVKLGENGTLRFTELSTRREVFKAVINVLQGAFRFTTDVAAKAQKREVSIGVSQVVAGIRGTDLWGRSRGNVQVVCLIEGRVEISAPGDPALTLDQPRQFYRREGGKALPVGFIDAKQLADWAREVDIEPGKGVTRTKGTPR